MDKILHKELSYRITGLLYMAQKELGRFCRERQYADYFENLLSQAKINYKREFEIKNFNSNSPGGNKVDFLIDDKIIIDLKAKNFIKKEDYFQMQRYLKAANLELGLIVNFRSSHLKPKRVLNNINRSESTNNPNATKENNFINRSESTNNPNAPNKKI